MIMHSLFGRRPTRQAATVLVTLLLAALPGTTSAGADQLEADTDAIESCMTTAWPRDVLALCVGVVANPCQEAQGNTTLGMQRCLDREALAWEALMGRLWPRMMIRAREIDAANATTGLGLDSAAETLEQAQRAWVVYRDAQCRHNYASWGQGSFRSVAYAACMLYTTARRSIDLHAQLMTGG